MKWTCTDRTGISCRTCYFSRLKMYQHRSYYIPTITAIKINSNQAHATSRTRNRFCTNKKLSVFSFYSTMPKEILTESKVVTDDLVPACSRYAASACRPCIESLSSSAFKGFIPKHCSVGGSLQSLKRPVIFPRFWPEHAVSSPSSVPELSWATTLQGHQRICLKYCLNLQSQY